MMKRARFWAGFLAGFGLIAITLAPLNVRAAWHSVAQGFVASGSSYTGPGDVVSGAIFYGGVRAYNAAYATGSNNAMTIRRASDNTTSNIVILSTGALDVATATTFCSATTCYVATLYNQSGGGAPNAVQTTNTSAAQPQLVFNCVNSTVPCIQFSGTQSLNIASQAWGATVQTLIAVANRTGGAGNFANMIWDTGANLIDFSATANTVYASCNNNTSTESETDGTWHAFQLVCAAGASASYITVDGSQNAVTLGAPTSATTTTIGNGAQALTGDIGEIIRYGAAASTAQQTSMRTNIKNFYGTP